MSARAAAFLSVTTWGVHIKVIEKKSKSKVYVNILKEPVTVI
jgi:hypothetical protein